MSGNSQDTELSIDEMGEFLEHLGMDDEAIDEYFAHFGVKGMKWGVRRAQVRAAKGPDRFGNRNNKQHQRRVDRTRRLASGKGTKGDKALMLLSVTGLDIARSGFSMKDMAKDRLDRAQKVKNKVEKGKKNTLDIMNRIGGVDIREIDFSYSE